MRITVICDVLGEENNGTTIAGMNLIRSLTEKGHEVRVVCPNTFEGERQGYYKVETLSLGFLNNYLKKNGVGLAKPDDSVIRAAMDGADVVHLLLPFSLSKRAVPIAKELGIPMTASFHFQAENFTAHLGILRCNALSNAIYRSRWKGVFRHVDCIHYPTKFIRDVFEGAIGRKTEGRVISNGVNRAFSENALKRTGSNGKFTIICTGRYSREKRQELLIKAVSLSKHKEEIRVILAGDGPRKKWLNSLAVKEGVDVQLKFFSREELLGALASSDLYVHTAEIEIEAIACLEAIASGLVPVIANSPRSATRYYALDDDNLFDHKSAGSLAEKIDFWFENKNKIPQNREKYRGFTKEIDYDVCMGMMERMLIDTANKRKTEGEK